MKAKHCVCSLTSVIFRYLDVTYATLSTAWITSTSTCASATPRCSLQLSSARRSPPLGSPSTTGVTPGRQKPTNQRERKRVLCRRSDAWFCSSPAGANVKVICTTPWVSWGRWGSSSTTRTSMWKCCLSRWSETTPTSPWGTRETVLYTA